MVDLGEKGPNTYKIGIDGIQGLCGVQGMLPAPFPSADADHDILTQLNSRLSYPLTGPRSALGPSSLS